MRRTADVEVPARLLRGAVEGRVALSLPDRGWWAKSYPKTSMKLARRADLPSSARVL